MLYRFHDLTIKASHSNSNMSSFKVSVNSEKARKELESLVRKKGNNVCSECSQSGPTWASLEFGVFVCVHCSGIFRAFPNHKLRAVRLDDWNDETVQVMRDHGNIKVNAVYEKAVPNCWIKPTPECSLLLREQWISSKYQQKEFVESHTTPQSYLKGVKKGIMFKLKKQGDRWLPRWFVLEDGNLKMYKSKEDRTPKHDIPVLQLNATINGNFGRMNAMQLITRMDGKSRNVYVYAESGREIIEWFCGIRAAKEAMVNEQLPGLSKEMLLKELSEDFVKSGYMYKTPPGTIKFQKRWFALDGRRLMYYNTDMDANPLGEIILGTAADKFSVEEKSISGVDDYSFTLHTPFRDFPLVVESQDEKDQWIKAFRHVLQQMEYLPMSPRVRCSTYELEL